MLGLEGRALRLERREVVEREHVTQSRERRALLVDLRHLGRVLAEHAHRLRVVEDVGDVLRRAVGVHRCSDGTDLGEREVEQRPLERRPRERREGLALAHAARQQAVREVLDPLRRLGPA